MPVHFGEFTLDESRRQLLSHGEAVHLSPKAFQLLSILIQETPRALSKAELQERLWPDTFVAEGNLASLVAELRAALGDDRRESKAIRTLYGFGYSFVAPIANTTASPQEPAAATGRPRFRWTTASVAAVLGAAGILLILSLRSAAGAKGVASTPPIRSIAILPFDTAGTDRSDEHLGLGLPDLLITRLSNVRNLEVRPTSAVRPFAGRTFDSRRIGRDLKVDAVLEGSIRATPDRVRVTVQLLNVRVQKPIWAERFDEKRAEMFSIEDDISARVAEALMVQISPQEKLLLARRYTSSPEAYQLYIQGRYRMEQVNAVGGLYAPKQAVELFEKAVKTDPQFALAWAGLALANALTGAGGRVSSSLAWPEAERAAHQALQLDPNLSESYAALGFIKQYWYLDYRGAQQAFRRALDLNPRNTIALMQMGYLLQCLGQYDEAIVFRKRAIESDPLNPNTHWGLANAYLTARRYEEALRQLQTVFGMEPNHHEGHIALIRIHVAQGKYDQAIATGKKIVAADGRPRGLAFLGYALGMAGRKAEAREILEGLKKRSQNEFVSPFLLAVVHMGLGEPEAVFPLLEKAVEDRQYAVRLKTEPVLDPLHHDPRFQALLKRAGFES